MHEIRRSPVVRVLNNIAEARAEVVRHDHERPVRLRNSELPHRDRAFRHRHRATVRHVVVAQAILGDGNQRGRQPTRSTVVESLGDHL